MSGLAEIFFRTSRTISGLALFKSASPMDYQSIKSAVHPGKVLRIDTGIGKGREDDRKQDGKMHANET